MIMKDILSEICAYKRIEVAKQKEAVPFDTIVEMAGKLMAEDGSPIRSMRRSLEESKS